MASLQAIDSYCNKILACDTYHDYAPNGLQIEGRSEVRCLVTGVTASQALIDAAIERQADLVLVHHGLFWKGESSVITGIKRQRIAALLSNNISLMAFHLPLDGHPHYGNNVQLGRLWGFEIAGRFGDGPDMGLGCYSELSKPLSIQRLEELVQVSLGHSIVRLGDHQHTCRRVGWCSGAAQGYIEQAAQLGLDTYISGEASEQTTHLARELGIHFLVAGHHATERGGVRAFGDHLAAHFGIAHHFIDINNPV